MPPSACIRLLTVAEENGALTVTLSPAGNQMQEIDFSLAGACLAKTCIGYGGYSSVTIQSGDRELTLKNNDLLFRDNSAPLDSSEEEKEP